ncbi:MAG: hypothetical protein ACPG4Q_02535 [Phycisphaeraceae bacterium]
MQNRLKTLGITSDTDAARVYAEDLDRLVWFRLIVKGLIEPGACPDEQVADLAAAQRDVMTRQRKLSQGHRSPIDKRIETFLRAHLSDVAEPDTIELPGKTFRLDRHGIARKLSLPAKGDTFENAYVQSTRVLNGVLHNPRHDRRTTAGTFHVAEGGLPVPAGKRAVPKHVFANMVKAAMHPPDDLMRLPFVDGVEGDGRSWVSLMLRPLVQPGVPGVCDEQTMEVRFFVPGALVSNLDFVESIFGNGGDADLPENDAGLDVEGWTGHTGCVILAPHLENMTKKELGLPHISEATDAQKRDEMCWESEDEKYNNGSAFKVTCRTDEGVIVTLIADNYFGYCKKEVKTQVSYAANLMGRCEEEHAGGTIAYPSYNLGQEFKANSRHYNNRTFDDIAKDYGDFIEVMQGGYGIDKNFPQVVYVPGDAFASIETQSITWDQNGESKSIPLRPGNVYVTPSGYRFRMAKHPSAPSWRLVGTLGEGAVCHKPCTVSGGGKSEISKSLEDYMLYGPIYVHDIDFDLNQCEAIIKAKYDSRWKPEVLVKQNYDQYPSRSILNPQRSLGSVIKLLTPSDEYTDTYNRWLESIPNYIFAILFAIKRLHKPEWGEDWRSHFTVDTVNGFPGHELKVDNRKVVGSYLRVGFDKDGAWRTFKLRQDFMPCEKMSTEDDISASITVPAKGVQGLNPRFQPTSIKFVKNCEYRFFQRPDEAIHRGFDENTERDLGGRGNFLCNFEPKTAAEAKEMVDSVVDFDQWTDPIQDLLREAADKGEGYVVSSAHPRIVNGKPTKNPRYLQVRPDLTDPLMPYLGQLGVQMFRALPPTTPALMPVNAVLTGRRNNPPDQKAGIRGLAVYNPVHYQPLPELFMEFISSLTGKSPSTTGAGSEGALTKRPFNALRPAADLNNALVSFVLTNLAGFSTSAGYVGPNVQVDHDISLLIPEIVARMSPHEIDPAYLIQNGYLEKIDDFEFEGEKILASRLGYRVTQAFVTHFFARVFDNPTRVFSPEMLRPEEQSLADYADGIKNITEAQQRVAREYFESGGVEDACPPLKSLLHIMAYGDHDGLTTESPDLRAMFELDNVLNSDWYQRRLEMQQYRDITACEKQIAYLESVVGDTNGIVDTSAMDLPSRLDRLRVRLAQVQAEGYVASLQGTLGADPLGQPIDSPVPAEQVAK